jgi:uncharacterized protein YdeI (YjbR/CyaY-like superfamily)
MGKEKKGATKKADIQIVTAATRKEWRHWLAENHRKETNVLLAIYHKTSGKESVYYEESVEEALCFGWIDSKANKQDADSFLLMFSKRKPASKWSKLNRERIEKLTDEGQIEPAGQAMIDLAKETGTWEALVDVQNSVVPDDLQQLFDKNEAAFKNFNAFPPSSKRIILEWILNAKRAETRQQRIEKTVELAAQNIRANHYN